MQSPNYSGRPQPVVIVQDDANPYPAGGSGGGSPSNPLYVDVGDLGAGEYETVAASQADQVLGTTGAVGDYLSHLLIIPATAAAGPVSIKDGTGAAITVFAGGATTALPTLAPIAVALGVRCNGAAWKVTTGANVSVIAVGNFT